MTKQTTAQRLAAQMTDTAKVYTSMPHSNLYRALGEAANHLLKQERAMKTLIEALKTDRHDWEDWPIASRTAIKQLTEALK